ncbi:Uncharacterized HTH-type transcriptional regulator yurK [uncultured Clostridium sp.]|nr:Uncharacterized HTH-type transcriptional regulator yurK [uncultured Clostridium sp.]
MHQDRLYVEIKNRICRLIYEGIYPESERIPPERTLAEQWNVSRVTVRKALELLEEENVVRREVGSGTRIVYRNTGHRGTMDTVTLTAPARSPFFSEFIEEFQKYADSRDSLVLFAQKAENGTIEDCLYRLYEKGLYNAVVWLDDNQMDFDRLKRLRALGMNMVFFDTDLAVPYADCIHLDNQEAVSKLCRSIRGQGGKRIGYLGWDREEIFSIRKRKEAFLQVKGQEDLMLELSWSRRREAKRCAQELIGGLLTEGRLPDAILCTDEEIGIAVSTVFERMDIRSVILAVIDAVPGSNQRDIITYRQDFPEISRKIYECLKSQNEYPGTWAAKEYPVKGILDIS